MNDLEIQASAFVKIMFPNAVCLHGRVSERFRIYRDDSDRSTSFIGTGRNQKAAWLDAASYVAEKERP